jgi:hypothetical protein
LIKETFLKKNRNISENAVRDFNKKKLEDLLFRRIGMFWVESYWEQSGEAGINAIERAVRILDALPLSGLKELYDFIIAGKRADASFRALLWLKRNGFIREEEL